MTDKPLIWVGSTLADVRRFPASVRQEVGHQLRRVQAGRLPDDWKPLSSVGLGVQEIRLHGSVEHRVLYIAKFDEAVYVLHAFAKRTQRTRALDIALAKARLAVVARMRRSP